MAPPPELVRWRNRRRSLAAHASTLESERHNGEWERLLFQTAFAGTIYPWCAASVLLPCHFIAYHQDLLTVFFTTCLLAVFLLLLSLCAYIYTFAFAMLASLAAVGALKLLDWYPGWVNRGAFIGSAVGYLSFLPWSLMLFAELPAMRWHAIGWWLSFVGAGPVLACLVGQVYGARAGLINVITGRRRTGLRKRQPKTVKDSSSTGSPAESIARPQFRLRQMLAAMVLVSVVLAVLKLAGLFTLPMLLATLLWLVVQQVARRPSIAVAESIRRRRFRRPRTSREVADSHEQFWRNHDKQMEEWKWRSERQGMR